MLIRLEIKNFAVIEHAVFEPTKGFNAVTGETGAGKSLLIDAISLVTGKKANRDIIRSDADFASVEAVFDIEELINIPEFMEFISKNEINIEDNLLIISRRISKDGKSIARINGSTVLLSVIREVADFLIDIHGQHDTQIIFDEKKHIDILDSFGKDYISVPFKAYCDKLDEVKACSAKIKRLSDKSDSLGNNDYLKKAVLEISEANLQEGEEEELDRKLKSLSLQKETMIYWNIINEALNGEDDKGITPLGRIESALNNLNKIKNIDSGLVGKEYFDGMDALMQSYADMSSETARLVELMEFDEDSFNRIENRIAVIYELKNKYGNSISEILEFERNANAELLDSENKEKIIKELKVQRQKLSEELLTASKELSEARHNAASILSSKIVSELSDLNMPNSKFEVCFTEHDKTKYFSSKGSEDVVFKFSGNRGENLKPLSSIVSGGEASRIMLAIKVILSDSEVLSTMIFDEIDTGVSGLAANSIATKLKYLGNGHQVLSVTHLSQIAASADSNYLIRKVVDSDVTKTEITKLDSESKVYEISRLLSGTTNTESLQLARELINSFL
ncbi:MAG: DNA repair protein RecN [Clostridia bacterium]|nr:DNA repair protein RecN [Clostridia bacterium]